MAMQKQSSITYVFGKRVRALRQQRRLSQEQLAELGDLDRTYISGIERGVRNVSLRNIEALAQALQVSLSELFKNL